jgi:hypothetical protein
MIYRIYPKKDATIYEDTARKNQNTGKDEILEVGKFYDPTNSSTLIGNSRVLIQFDLDNISSLISSGDISGSIKYYLNLESTEEKEIASNYTLYVYPVKEQWLEGIGKESDTPHNEVDVSWVYRISGSTWDVENETVNKPTNPETIANLLSSYTFASSIDPFVLDPSQSILGTDGTSPSLSIENGRMKLSGANYGGGTAVLSASLLGGQEYTITFEINPSTLSGVDFRVGYNGGYLTNLTNYTQSIVAASTQSVKFTPNTTGTYEVSLTFFDRNGLNGSVGYVDNFYIYGTPPSGTLIWDTYAIVGVSSVYYLNNVISGSNFEIPTTFVSESKLYLSASNFGGASVNRNYDMYAGVEYTSSFYFNTGSGLHNLKYQVIEPDGREEIFELLNQSGPYTQSFTADQNGEYSFRWSYYASGSGQGNAFIQNFKLQTDPLLYPTSSLVLDNDYEARSSVNSGGGTWYTSSFLTGNYYYQSFDKYVQNLNVEVTDYINDFLQGHRENYGFIILKSKEDETSTRNFGTAKFFSSDTHTIYVPNLEVRWNNTTFTTGSLSPQTNSDLIVYVKDFQSEYKENSKSKIRVYGRERYPSRNFSLASPIKSIKYLPTTTYYSVVDAETNKTFIPFDDTYTKLSCDSTSNYFNFWFNGLQPERYYKFIFKVVDFTNGTTKYYDDNFYFKVVR